MDDDSNDRDARGAEPVTDISHALLLAAVDSLSDGFVLFDPTGRLLMCNARYRQMYPEMVDMLVPGTAVEELLREYARRTAAAGDASWPERAARRIAAWREGRRFEQRTPAGRWIEIRDQRTAAGHVIGLRFDVTERRLAQSALRESEARYRSLVENATEAITVLDTVSGLFTDVNPAAEALFRMDRAALLEHGPAALSPAYQPDGAASARRAAELVGRALAGDRPVFDWLHLDAGGNERLCEVRLVRLGAPGSTLVRGSITDIGRQRAAALQLETTSRQLQLTLESIEQGISMFDSELRLTIHNRRLVELTGFDDMPIRVGDRFEDLVRANAERGEFGPGDVDQQVRERLQLVTSGQMQRFTRVRPDGRVLDCVITPLPDGGFVSTYTDVTHSHELSRSLSYQARHDQLTGLVNRWEFEQRLARLIERTADDDSQHALCYLDLDQFKVINDTCGHMAGDELLRQLGAQLQGSVRQRDTLARLGGDEFGLIMEHCSMDNALGAVGKLLQLVEEFQFAWQGRAFRISASIGLVPVNRGVADVAEAMRQADTACYAAKDRGRNQVYVPLADDEELSRRQGEMQWVSRINAALDEDRFELYFQPIVATGGDPPGAGLHFEMLLRMREADGTLVPPGAFLPAAERYNLAARLDLWVVQRVLDWLAASADRLRRVNQCAINLSGASLGDERIMRHVLTALERGPVRAGQLCFEITETAAIAHLRNAHEFMATLAARGCRFALDDFGTGLSSFGYLRNLPVDYLKIDGTFVRGIGEDPIDLAMVRSINEIGHVLGKQTIAEFVENDAVLACIRGLGVDYAQGYGIARPMPVSELG